MLHLRLAALLVLSLATAPSFAQKTQSAAIIVSIEGAVTAPGQYTLPGRARLSEAVSRAHPSPTAYPLGAALLRQNFRTEQSRQKAGLLYDLKILQVDTANPGAPLALALSDWLKTLPVTGRVSQQLDARLLEIDRAADPLAETGDLVIYPTRPDYIRVVGAVERPCQLPHAPTKDARYYLLACPPSAVADSDVVYAVQPDGHVQKIGIALWNRGPVQPLAPGAFLYIPLAQRLIRDLDPEFNLQFAQFLATQLLPAPGVTP